MPSSSTSSTSSYNPGQTAVLLQAAQGGNEDQVRAALRDGADPDAHDRHKTALHWAVYGGHETIVTMLLDAEARTDRLNHRGETALQEVAIYGTAYQDDDGPARAARITQRLLAHGANPHQVSQEEPMRNGQLTVAHSLASASAGDLALEDILRMAPDLVHAVNQRGATPLMTAVQEGRMPQLERLLRAGSDPYAKTLSGESPMSVAQRINPGMVERINVELVNREREALLPLVATGVASMTPPRPKARL